MARPATGSIVEPKGSRRSWGIRFRANGKREYLTLGLPEDGWNRRRAEEALRDELDRVRLGVWQPPKKVAEDKPSPMGDVPTFHEYAEEWLARKEPDLRPGTLADYRWALEHHLLGYFGSLTLDAITPSKVKEYGAVKLREKKIGPNQINKTLTRLTSILEEAVDDGLIEQNNAAGKRRRVKATEPQRSRLEPEQLPSLVEAADGYMRPVLAVLAGCGLRVGEAVALDWRDVNFGAATINVRGSKTAAGVREVDVPLGALSELLDWKARTPKGRATDPVFVSRARKGRNARQTKRNVEARLKAIVADADDRLQSKGIAPIGDVTPHGLRRTYTSLRAACGDNPVYIAEQAGHADIRITYRIYQRAAKRRDKLSGATLREFDRALEWARMGTKGTEAITGPDNSNVVQEAEMALQSDSPPPPGV